MYRVQRPGHWWGDDWALYLRQAQALLDGDPNRVAAENAFSVAHSRGAPYSPPLYPWGFPILLAPAIAAFGTNLDRLALVEVISALVMAVAWYALARRRLGTVVAMVGMVALTMSPLLMSWTELIQSELPFVAAALSALVAIDAAVAHHVFSPTPADWTRRSWWWLVLIGFSAAAAFTIRREGLALFPAIAAAQFSMAITQASDSSSAKVGFIPGQWLPAKWRLLAVRLTVPYAVAGIILLALQMTMPATVVPRYGGTTVLNIWNFRLKIAANLAETVGLKRTWEPQPQVFTNVTLGWIVIAIFLCLGVMGVALGLTLWHRRDAHLAVYTVGAFVIGASFRGAINRYVASVGPLLLLFGLCVVAAAFARFQRRWLTVLAPTVLLLALLAADIASTRTRMEWADQYAIAGAVEWGPTHPDARAMFDAINSLAAPDDVIASPKARAMVFETGRPSVQVDDFRPIPDDVPVAFVVVETNSKLLVKLRKDPAHYVQVWANARFVIFQIT